MNFMNSDMFIIRYHNTLSQIQRRLGFTRYDVTIRTMNLRAISASMEMK